MVVSYFGEKKQGRRKEDSGRDFGFEGEVFYLWIGDWKVNLISFYFKFRG